MLDSDEQLTELLVKLQDHHWRINTADLAVCVNPNGSDKILAEGSCGSVSPPLKLAPDLCIQTQMYSVCVSYLHCDCYALNVQFTPFCLWSAAPPAELARAKCYLSDQPWSF